MRGRTLRPIDVMFINGREMFPALNPLFGSLFHFTDPALYIPLHHHRHHHRCRFQCQGAPQTWWEWWDRTHFTLATFSDLVAVSFSAGLSYCRADSYWAKIIALGYMIQNYFGKKKRLVEKKQSSKKIKKHRQRHTVPNIDKKENGRGF